MVVDRAAHLVRQFARIHEVGHANAAAGHLVLVGGADAASGGADGLGSGGALAGLIHGNVVRHDQGCGRADLQP